jgi:hypothetical protein
MARSTQGAYTHREGTAHIAVVELRAMMFFLKERTQPMDKPQIIISAVLLLLAPAVVGLAEFDGVDSISIDGTPGGEGAPGPDLLRTEAPPLVMDLTPERAADALLSSQIPFLEHPEHDRAMMSRFGSAMLVDLEPELKTNAHISIEPFATPGTGQILQAAWVAKLWNTGLHSEAIAALEDLEATGTPFAVMISWDRPLVDSPQKVYTDKRLGGARTGGQDAALDFDAGTGNLFAMIVWEDGWSMNMSTDRGVTWVETHYYSGVTAIADMVVSGDYAWVGYSASGDSFHSSRFRRFDVATGLHDDVYGWEVVADESPNTMIELVVTSNAPDDNNRIYIAYLVDETDSVHFWWDDLSGTSFAAIPPAISNARESLDMAWNPYAVSDHYRWISYIGTDNKVHVWRSSGSTWNLEVSRSFTGLVARTAISAYSDHIYCAFECQSEPGKTGVCYLVTDDAGVSSWLADDAYWPTGSEVSGFSPDISVRSGSNRAVVFSSETGDIDDVYYVTRSGWSVGGWSDPVWYNTHDHISGEATYIEWLGALGVFSYGMIYFDGTGDHAPYFDLLTVRALFFDGFESGDFSAWDSP